MRASRANLRGANHISYHRRSETRPRRHCRGKQAKTFTAPATRHTKARVGDLILLSPRSLHAARRRLAAPLVDAAISPGNRPISLSHCEIVVGIDHEKKITSDWRQRAAVRHRTHAELEPAGTSFDQPGRHDLRPVQFKDERRQLQPEQSGVVRAAADKIALSSEADTGSHEGTRKKVTPSGYDSRTHPSSNRHGSSTQLATSAI